MTESQAPRTLFGRSCNSPYRYDLSFFLKEYYQICVWRAVDAFCIFFLAVNAPFIDYNRELMTPRIIFSIELGSKFFRVFYMNIVRNSKIGFQNVFLKGV